MKLRLVLISLLLLIVLGCPHQAAASYAYLGIGCGQGTSSGISGTTFTCSSANGVGGGCAPLNSLTVIIAGYYQSSGSVSNPTITDTNSNSWTTDADSNTAINNYRNIIAHAISNNSACETYTITLSQAMSFGIFRVIYFTGNSLTSPFDAIATPLTFNTQANPQVGPNLTTTQTGDVIVSTVNCAAGGGVWGTGSGYTIIDSSGFNAWWSEYQIVGAAGSYNATYTSNQTCVFGTSIGNLLTVAFKTPAPAGSGFPMVIKYRSMPHVRIPWDTRRRKLEIVRI